MIISLIVMLASLMLAVRAMRFEGQSFRRNAWMAGSWLVIIAVLALVINRFGVPH